MKTLVTISVRLDTVDKRGHVRATWERSTAAENEIPAALLVHELLHLAHTRLHPPKPIGPPPRHD
jgi:hypothetical protein